MATRIKPELSKNHKYWISKHRYYELKHYCLQYPLWKNAYYSFNDISIPLSMIENVRTCNLPGDPTAKRALMKAYYADKIGTLESVAIETDRYLHKYILKAVTEDLSFNYLKTKLDIPCCRDTYYDRYRRFFWILDRNRD